MPPRNGTVLVVDDEEIMREILDALLTREGYDVRLAASGAEALEIARAVPIDAAVVDVMMPGMDGLSVLDELKKLDEDIAVIMITAFASVETAIAAMKRGAFDYITKPFKNDEVLVVLRNAVERRRLVAENVALKQNLQERYSKFGNIIGRSPRMRQVFDLIIQAAPSRSTILVGGESGTGKELVARAIHSNSPRVRARLHHRQLGEPAARPARVEPVRPREGRVHRRGLPEEGPLRAGRQGEHLLRRDWQHAARDPAQAAARDAGAGVHAAGRRRDDQGGRADHRGDQRGPAADGGGAAVPGGPVLPAARHHGAAAAAARAEGRHPAARAALPAEVRGGEREAGPRAVPRRARPADGVRLAGQRPRARERDRARRRALHGGHASAPTWCRTRSGGGRCSRCRSSRCRPRGSSSTR